MPDLNNPLPTSHVDETGQNPEEKLLAIIPLPAGVHQLQSTAGKLDKVKRRFTHYVELVIEVINPDLDSGGTGEQMVWLKVYDVRHLNPIAVAGKNLMEQLDALGEAINMEFPLTESTEPSVVIDGTEEPEGQSVPTDQMTIPPFLRKRQPLVNTHEEKMDESTRLEIGRVRELIRGKPKFNPWSDSVPDDDVEIPEFLLPLPGEEKELV